jgi:hypothetical protein
MLLISMIGVGSAFADVWTSRTGFCFEWEGRWSVTQEQYGLWVGNIEFIHIGGRCVNPTHQIITSPVRAIIAGDEFFGLRGSCHMHGRLAAALFAASKCAAA